MDDEGPHQHEQEPQHLQDYQPQNETMPETYDEPTQTQHEAFEAPHADAGDIDPVSAAPISNEQHFHQDEPQRPPIEDNTTYEDHQSSFAAASEYEKQPIASEAAVSNYEQQPNGLLEADVSSAEAIVDSNSTAAVIESESEAAAPVVDE